MMISVIYGSFMVLSSILAGSLEQILYMVFMELIRRLLYMRNTLRHDLGLLFMFVDTSKNHL